MGEPLLDILERVFGHRQFRRPQREIVESVLSGRDTLAIMPTGGGKSLCYQLPAVACDGVALVVSPLVALMKDQVDSLAGRGVAAAMINSLQSGEQQRITLSHLRTGRLKIVYISPERFRTRSFARSLEGLKISLFAVDEAHCISQWGHDFRPDYMRLGNVIDALGRPPVAAFTATATPDVRADIIANLRMRNPAVFVSGFARPNLSFNVREVSGKAEKDSRVRELIDKYKVGIIYCATRKSVEALSETLWDDGVRHISYHGGMTPSERDSAQDVFVGGKESVVVATNAFGMGIDRPDIRFVCHYELTGSVEAFYQEAGRAGRDGAPSYCEMLLMYSDKRVQEFFIDGANPEADYIRAVYSVLRANSGEGYECSMPVADIAAEAGKFLRGARARGLGRGSGFSTPNAMAASSAISVLRRLGVVDRYDIPGARARGTRLLQPDMKASELPISEEELALKRKRDEGKLRDLISFAYSRECRQEWILKYFGQNDCSACGTCDNCRRKASGEGALEGLLDDGQIEVVRKALSCVARLSRRVAPRCWTPVFGRNMVRDCLAGSRSERISRFALDDIPTYGALKSLGKEFIGGLLKAMEDAGLVETTRGEYPLLGLTREGVSVMMGESSRVRMDFPSIVGPAPDREGAEGLFSAGAKISKGAKSLKPLGKKGRPASKLGESSGRGRRARGKGASGGGAISQDLPLQAENKVPLPSGGLFERLVRLRTKISRARKVPAYAVFPNAVLKLLSQEMPGYMDEALKLKGIGLAKAATVLPAFLEEIRKFKAGE